MIGIFKPKRLDTLCDNLHQYIGQEFEFDLYADCIDWNETYNGQKAYSVLNHDDMWRLIPEEDIEFCGGAEMTGLDIVTELAKGGLKEGESFVRLDEWRNMIITMKDGNLIDCWGQAMTWSVHNLNAEWEKVEPIEPKPQLDDWEKETCKRLLAKGWKWLGRDKDGYVWGYEEIPYKGEAMWIDYKYDGIGVPDGFDFVKWEDSEPTSIEELLQ